MKRFLLIVSIIIALTIGLTGCKEKTLDVQDNMNEIQNEYVEIRFLDMYETNGREKNVSSMLKDLNGKKVKIKGYAAVQSPLDESFLYLNNQPYVTCPFCTMGDITKLEVIPIYMANGSKIKYTEDAIVAYGTLEVEEKVDSEKYTTQFRIYADKIETLDASSGDKTIQNYYNTLTQAGMIYDIQSLQMNIEYVSNPEYMSYYGTTRREIVENIIGEYIKADEMYIQNVGEGYSYLAYISECPGIISSIEVEDDKLKKLNDELIKIYNDQIDVLTRYSTIVYKYNGRDLTDKEIDDAYNELINLNKDNIQLYNRFIEWNNRLRE